MKTCPRCHKQRPDDEVAHTCVVRLDHESARFHAEEVVKLEETVACLGNLSNLSACYLDAMAQLEAVRLALGGYKDSDLASLATTLMARLDKATELLRELIDGLVPCNEPVEPGSVVARVDAFLDERK